MAEYGTLRFTRAADAEPPPPHYHPSQDEHFEVLEGSIALRVGHEHRTVPAGESFDIPRGTVHTMGPAGVPAKVRRELTEEERTGLMQGISHYPDLARTHRAALQGA